MIHNVVIGSDLNDKLRLTGAFSRFPYGTRQICLRFDYSKAEEGSEVRILWFSGERLVRSDAYPLSVPSGSKIYCLLQENGQPLPKGPYSLGILHKAEKAEQSHEFKFEIY